VESIKRISEYVAQLRRVGKGHGKNFKLWYLHFLLHRVFVPMIKERYRYILFVFLDELSGVWHFDQMLLHEGAAA